MKVAFPGPCRGPGKLNKPSAKVENQEFRMVSGGHSIFASKKVVKG